MEIGSGICIEIKGIFSIYLSFSPFFAEQTVCGVAWAVSVCDPIVQWVEINGVGHIVRGANRLNWRDAE